jgi:hypothetical protein
MTFFTIALSILAVLWTLTLVLASPVSVRAAQVNAFIPLSIFSVLAVIFAVKGNNQLTDRIVYTNELQYIAGHTLREAFGLSFHTAREPFYILFMWAVSNGGQTTAWLYFCVGTACVLTYVFSILKLLPLRQTPLIWLTTLALGFFTSYASLVARQGLSMAALFAAICLIFANVRSRWWILLLIVSALIHWSAIPIALAVALVALTRVHLRVYVGVWIGASTLFIAGAQEKLLEPVSGMIPGLNEYVNVSLNRDYLGGVNRRDFFLFSLVLLAFGLLALWKGAPPPWYSRLIAIYCALNTYFLLFGFILYSDRLAAYSWTLAPLILATPFAEPTTGMGRMRTIAFATAIVAFGFIVGPFGHMTGIKTY